MLMSELPTPKIDRMRKALDFARESEAAAELRGSGAVPVTIEGNGTIKMAWNQSQWFKAYAPEYAAKYYSDLDQEIAPVENSDWFAFTEDTELFRDFDAEQTMTEGVCGTAGCLAGWGVVAYAKTERLKMVIGGYSEFSEGFVSTPDGREVNTATAAQQYVFGITDEEADALFDGNNDLELIEEIIQKIEDGEYRHGDVNFNGQPVEDAPQLEGDDGYEEPEDDEEDDDN